MFMQKKLKELILTFWGDRLILYLFDIVLSINECHSFTLMMNSLLNYPAIFLRYNRHQWVPEYFASLRQFVNCARE